MQQKLHRLNVRIASRLQAMADHGQQQPQLVRTKELLQLTEFEEQVLQLFVTNHSSCAHPHKVIVYLAGKSIAAVKFESGAISRYGGFGSGEIKVGTLLNLFSPTFGESIENRKRFGKNGPLVKNGFIIIHSPRS
jgi:hypothetical protein